MAANAGESGDIILLKYLRVLRNWMDFRNNQLVNLINTGIIDPVQVIKYIYKIL